MAGEFKPGQAPVTGTSGTKKEIADSHPSAGGTGFFISEVGFPLDDKTCVGVAVVAHRSVWINQTVPVEQGTCRIGRLSETTGAKAAYLEFKGDGLSTFERALDRSERLLAVLGSRLLESQKRVSKSAEALAIRQVGEGSIIANISTSVTASLNGVLRWVYWWQSTEATPEDVKPEHIHYELNTDFEASLMGATEIQALVAAWQSGAISRDTLLHNFRTGEILPSARTNEEELELIRKEPAPVNVVPMGAMGAV